MNKIALSLDQIYIMYLLCRVYVYQFVNSYRNVLVFVGDLIREVRTASEDGRIAIACHRRTRARYCRVDHRNWINRYPCNGEQHTLRVVCGKNVALANGRNDWRHCCHNLTTATAPWELYDWLTVICYQQIHYSQSERLRLIGNEQFPKVTPVDTSLAVSWERCQVLNSSQLPPGCIM